MSPPPPVNREPSSPSDSVCSPTATESSATSSSLSLTDSSFSGTISFCEEGEFGTSPPTKKDQKLLSQMKKKKKEVMEFGDGQMKHLEKSVPLGPLRDTKKKALKGGHEACCRYAGVFAADCTAVCCCPCAIFPLLAFVLVELPSALAAKMIAHLKSNRLQVKSSLQPICSSKNGAYSSTIFTPSGSFKEPRDNKAETHIIRFDTQNLLKHFEAENVGFGCLSQKRD